MADASNIKIEEQINKMLKDRTAMLQAQSREMQSQLQFALQIKAIFNDAKAQDLIKDLDEAQKAFESITAKAKETADASNGAMEAISLGAEKAASSTNKFQLQTKLLQAKFPFLKSTGVAALSGLSQGFTNLLALGKGFTGVLESSVGFIFNIGKAILSIPLNIFRNLVDMAGSMDGDTSLAQAFEDLRKDFGSFKQDVSKNVIGGFQEIQKGFTGTGLSAYKVLGSLANQLKYFHEIAKGAGAQMHQFGAEVASNAGLIAGMEKGLGVGAENIKAYMDKATISGKSLTKTMLDTANYSLQMGEAFGMSQKVLAKDITMMMKDVKNFGSLTQKEMSVASVYTRKLGLEVKDLLGTIDKFDTFEDAANNAAQLSQAFGGSVDAFKMMNEQDPAKRLDMLRESMKAAGKTSENMSRQELKLLENTTGLSAETAKLAFASKNQGLTYDQVRKQSEKAEKKQLTQAQAMSKLADSIERVIQHGESMKGGFLDQFIEGFERGIKWSKPFMSLMINLRQALYATKMAGFQVGQAFAKMFPGFEKMFSNFASMFSKERFQPLLNGVVSTFKTFFKDLNFSKLIENLQKGFYDWFGVNSAAGKGFLDGVKQFFTAISKIAGEGIKWLIPKLTDGFKTLTEFLADPKKFLEKAKSSASGMGFMMEILDPFIKAVDDKKMWVGLWDAFKGFAGQFWDLLWNQGIKPLMSEMPASMWLGAAAILFGPAVSRSILTVGVSVLGDVLKNTMIKSAEKAIASKAAEAAITTMSESLVKKGAEAAASAATDAVVKGAGTAASSAASSAPGVSAAAPLLANPFVLIAAAAVVIAVGAFALAATSMKTESEKLQDSLDSEDFLKKLQDKNASTDDRIKLLKQERLKQLKKADDEAGVGILNFLRGGQSEHEADARSRAESYDKQLQDEKLKKDRELIVGTPEYQSKIAAAAIENKKRILDAMGPVTTENAGEKFKKIDDLAKKVMSKDFDLSEKLKMIREKLDNVDFSLFKDKSKEDQVNQALSGLESVKALFAVIADVGILSNKAISSIKTIDNKGMKDSLESLKSFVHTIAFGIVEPKFIEQIQTTALYAKSIAVNTEVITSSLISASKGISSLNAEVKNMQATKMPATTTAILGMINSTNVVVGDASTLKDSSDAVKKLTSVVTLFSSLTDVTKAFDFLQNDFAKGMGNFTIDKITKSMSSVSAGVNSAMSMITGDIAKTLEITKGIVKSCNDLNNVLASGDSSKIKLTESLKKFVDNSGMGKSGSYKIENNGITMHVHLEVKMNAAEVEEVLVLRHDSIIKDGIKNAAGLNEQENTKLKPYL